MIDLGYFATTRNSYTRPLRKCVSFFVRVLLGFLHPPFVYSRECFTLAVVFEAYTSQAFSPFSCWSPKMSPFGGLSNKDLVLFFTFPRTVYSRVSCCFLLRRYTFQALFSFLVDPRKCLFSLGYLTRIWFLSLTFPRTVYSRVSWCFLLRRYTFQAFFFVWSPKVISFRCLPNKKSLFPTILREMSPLVFRCCFSLGALLLSSFFPLCLISESCFPFVYYLTRVGCLRIFSFDLFLPKGLCHLSVSEKDVWLPIPF